MTQLIISNILGDQVISDEAGKFYKVADSTEEYAEMIEPICLSEDGRGGSDHFISTIRSINSLWKYYSYYGIDEILEKIKETPSLLMWFSMVVTVMLYGCNTGNRFSPVKISFADNRPYLKVWKDKLSISDQYDNCIGKENVIEDGLNVYYFDEQKSSSIAGCCSRKFFIIPSREIRKDGEHSQWKDFYHKLIDVPCELNRNLFVKTSPIQKILLLLSARSLPDESPLKMIKDIIFAYINLPLRGFDELPALELGNISLYSVGENYIPLSMYSEKISLVYSDKYLHALYPFNPSVIEEIEKGKCIVKSVSMSVSESAELDSDESSIDMVTVTGAFVYNITFTGQSGKSVTLPYHFNEKHDYPARAVFYLSELPTFCMFPDIPLEYENMCHEYTFFSNRKAMLKSYDHLSNYNNFVKISDTGIECFSITNDKTFEISNGNYYTFDLSSAKKPNHLIKVISNQMYLGTVINLRKRDGEPCPVLLDQNVNAEINLTKINEQADVNMSVYVNFGGQNCSVGYKVSNGEPYYNSISGGTPTVRLLLGGYEQEYYSPYMNVISNSIAQNIVPTYMVSYFDNIIDINDLTPYHGAFLPFRNNTVEFEDKKQKIYNCYKNILEKEHRKSIADSKSEACVKAIIHNLCYTAVCHALNKGCNRLYVYPAIPGRMYEEYTSSTWDSAIKNIKKIFDISIINMLHYDERYYLYEGIVSLSGVGGIASDTLLINVEIGHTLTKLAAVSSDSNGDKRLCAYSTFEIGGKDLLYQCVYDALSHCDSALSAKKLLFSNNGGSSLFVTKQRIKSKSASEAEQAANRLCKKFFPNNKRKGRPRDDSWCNVLSELLELVEYNDLGDPNTDIILYRANFVFRYALLVQIVNDFIAMVLGKIDANFRRMIVRFDGAAAKGLKTADEITAGEKSFMKATEASVKELFPQCSVEINDNPDKLFMKSLCELTSIDIGGHGKLSSENELFDLQESILPNDITAEDTNELFNINNDKYFYRYCVDTIHKYIKNPVIESILLKVCENIEKSKTAIEINEAFSKPDGTMQLMCSVSDLYSEMTDSVLCMIEACKLVSECYGEELSPTI